MLGMSITFDLSQCGGHEAINLANCNAAALLALSGLPTEPGGAVAGDELGEVIARLMRALNLPAHRIGADAPALTSASGRYVDAGRTDDYLVRRGTELLALFVAARQRDIGVVWG